MLTGEECLIQLKRQATAEFHIQQSDIRPLVLEQLRTLADDAERALANTNDRYTRTHLEYVIRRVNELIF